MQEIDKPVDIDISGPGAEVTLDEKIEETLADNPTQEIADDANKEEGVKYDNESNDSPEKPTEHVDVQEGEEKNTEQKKELEEYSDGVKRRIAKLTKKCVKQKDVKKRLLFMQKVFWLKKKNLILDLQN
tara:strand:+ start:1627 stop:2013 length:387 start_codon:yes stop_codon:yes gene_type:complete